MCLCLCHGTWLLHYRDQHTKMAWISARSNLKFAYRTPHTTQHSSLRIARRTLHNTAGFRTTHLYAFIFHLPTPHMQATCPANLIVLHLTTLSISGEQNTSPCPAQYLPAPSVVARHQFLHHIGTGTSYGPNAYVNGSVCNMNRTLLRLDIPLSFEVNNYVIPVNTTRQFVSLLLRNSEPRFWTSLCQRQPDSCRVHDADRPMERRIRSALRLASSSISTYM